MAKDPHGYIEVTLKILNPKLLLKAEQANKMLEALRILDSIGFETQFTNAYKIEEEDMPEIEHKKWFDGQIQALGFEDEYGKKTVGVVLPGVHDFGKADAPETIIVVYGSLIINGAVFSATRSCDIKAGDQIVFEAEKPAAYICYKK